MAWQTMLENMMQIINQGQQKMEENRKEDRNQQEKLEERKEEVKAMKNLMLRIKEDIRKETQAWLAEIRRDNTQNKQDLETVVQKTMEIENRVHEQEGNIEKLGRKIITNEEKIEQVKKEVQMERNISKEEWEIEKQKNEKKLQELQKEILETRERKNGNVTRVICHGENKINKFGGQISYIQWYSSSH